MPDNNEYVVLNYVNSPVSITTKHDNYLVPGGTYDNPGILPLSMEEIQTINTNGLAFKGGLLFFEPEYEEDIYKTLRILNWQKIFKPMQIEDMLLHPTVEGLQSLIDADSEILFDRIYGIYLKCKRYMYVLSPKVELIIEARKEEWQDGKRASEITVKSISDNSIENSESSKEIDLLKSENKKLFEQIEEMKNMLSNLSADKDVATDKRDVPVDSVQDEEKSKSVGRKKTK